MYHLGPYLLLPPLCSSNCTIYSTHDIVFPTYSIYDRVFTVYAMYDRVFTIYTLHNVAFNSRAMWLVAVSTGRLRRSGSQLHHLPTIG